MDPQLKHADPTTLEIHPVLDGFPPQSPDEYEALKTSIAAQGIKVELRGVINPETGAISIYSGRGRRRAAMELALPKVPVLVNGIKETSLMEFVIDEVTTGRQLTKSGIVLLLFEKHPSLSKEAHRRMKNGKKKPCDLIAGSEEGASYVALAERYKVPRDYFSMLAELRSKCKSADWELVRKAIIEEQYSIPRIRAGQAGRDATKGSKKTAPVYLVMAPNGKLSGVMPEAVTGLRNGFKQWAKLDLTARGALREQWLELMETLPEDLQ